MEMLVRFLEGGVAWASLELLKATVLLLVVFAVAALLRRASAGARHLVWGVGLVALLALPIASALSPWRLSLPDVAKPAPAAPQASVEASPPPVREAPTFVSVATEAEASSISNSLVSARETPRWTMRQALVLVAAIWAFGAAIVLVRLIAGVVLVRRAMRRARPLDSADWRGPLFDAADRLELRDAPRLLLSADLPMPFVAGVLRPKIVLPDSAVAWNEDRRRAVLLHELAHVRRADLALNLIVRVVCALYWFHPLVRVAAHRMRADSERACDDLVLQVGTPASTYADHLLDIVRRAGRSHTPAVALPMAQRNEFEGRMLAILEADVRRDPPRRRHAALAAAGGVMVVLALAAMTPAAADQATTNDAQRLAIDNPPNPVIEPPPPPASRASPQPEARSDVDVDGEEEEAELAQPVKERAPQDTTVVSALIAALQDSNAEVREEAVWALGSLEARSALSALMGIVANDAEAEVREMAAWALVQIGDATAAGVLGDAVRNDADAEVRATAIWGLGQFGVETEAPALAEALSDSDAEVRSRAAWALGTIAPASAPPALIRAVDDEDEEVREAAAWALGKIGDPAALDALVGRVGDEQAGEAALWAISRIGGERARPALLEALRSGNDEVRAAAARALAGRGDHHSWPWPWPMPRPR